MPKKSPAPERVDARVVDSHCHLQSFEATEREEVLDAARARGVGGFLVPSIELDDRSLLLELSDRHPDVWCSAGCHPNHAETWRRGDAERLADAARDLRIVAIGECGLDFHYDRSPRAHQERVMREQWEVAVDLGLPVIVHNRDSNARMLEIRRRPEFDALRVDFHSFSGGAAMAEEVLERGDVLGLSGMITFQKADNVREVLPLTPRDRLLVETDAPYLAPAPYRGRPNRPAYVIEVLDRLARELGHEIGEVARMTTDNFFRTFPRAAALDAAL